MGSVESRAEGRRHNRRTRILSAALCGCALVTFSAAQAARLQPGRLQHVICKAPATVSTYSFLWDAPDFAVVVFTSTPRPVAASAPLALLGQPAAAPGLLEFSLHVRPPPAA